MFEVPFFFFQRALHSLSGLFGLRFLRERHPREGSLPRRSRAAILKSHEWGWGSSVAFRGICVSQPDSRPGPLHQDQQDVRQDFESSRLGVAAALKKSIAARCGQHSPGTIETIIPNRRSESGRSAASVSHPKARRRAMRASEPVDHLPSEQARSRRSVLRIVSLATN